MKRHPILRKIVAQPGMLAALCVLGLGFASVPSRAQDTGANVARISFVDGSVQLMAGQGNDFEHAVMNMPVVEGSQLQTGSDGQVEIEFGDGSVARLTPNSSVQFGRLGLDQVQLQQLGGLTYYEFNVGQGHPAFDVQFANVDVQPTGNTILRVGLDAGWEVAVVNGSLSLQGQGLAPVTVAENQSARSGGDNSGAPYTVAQGINGDSWDNWNQDRDQAIAQEATSQTAVRNDSADADNENWNDLDSDGDWYPVQGQGNVWVPAGVGPNWDPYGSGYWAYYPTMGYTWVSGYSWGWLPYHCGAWNYYSFGWGWAPGGCGRTWSPVIIVRNHPPGWSMPVRPVFAVGGVHPLPGRVFVVDRGPEAKGPWGFHGGPALRPDHLQTLNFRGNEVAPIARVDVHSQAFVAARGTAPGTRAVLSGSSFTARPAPSSTYYGTSPQRNGSASPGVQRPIQPTANVQHPVQPTYSQHQPPAAYGSGGSPAVNYGARPQAYSPPAQSYNQQRNGYVSQPASMPHYSSPPPQQQHYSPPPPPSHPAPSGNHR